MDWKLILCMGLAAAGLLFGLSQWLRARRQLERMDRMLDRAIDGSFLESSFDESVPSALESKMSRFLNGSASSARNLAEEKSKIAALIADVSHQTKTPIANLLLYASLLAESELTPEQRAQAEALKTQAEKLSFLVDALVKSSRLDNGILTLSPAPHPIQPLLDGAAAQGLAAAGQRGISLTVLPWEARPALTQVDGGSPLQCSGQRLEIYPARRDSDPVRHRLPYVLLHPGLRHRPRYPGGGAGPDLLPLLPGGRRPGAGRAGAGPLPHPPHPDQRGGLYPGVLSARKGQHLLPLSATGVTAPPRPRP